MLKDLFFSIWYDEMGSGWLLLVTVLFLLCCAFLVFKLARLKAKNEKLLKKHFICLSFIILIMYQIIPVSIDFIANLISPFDIKRSLQLEQFAIKTSVIPWQKGGYYCNLATLHMLDKDYKKMYENYDIAYKYLKSYKSPSLGISYLHFYTKGDYDSAIEIAENWKGGKTPYQFISNCYLMKGDIKNAELYIDKAIQQKESFSKIATKAYILKVTGKTKDSLAYYEKAKQLCKNEKEKHIVENTYKNFIEYENNRLNILRKQQGLE